MPTGGLFPSALIGDLNLDETGLASRPGFGLK